MFWTFNVSVMNVAIQENSRVQADDVQAGIGEVFAVSLRCSRSCMVCNHCLDVPPHQMFAVITEMFRITPTGILQLTVSSGVFGKPQGHDHSHPSLVLSGGACQPCEVVGRIFASQHGTNARVVFAIDRFASKQTQTRVDRQGGNDDSPSRPSGYDRECQNAGVLQHAVRHEGAAYKLSRQAGCEESLHQGQRYSESQFGHQQDRGVLQVRDTGKQTTGISSRLPRLSTSVCRTPRMGLFCSKQDSREDQRDHQTCRVSTGTVLRCREDQPGHQACPEKTASVHVYNSTTLRIVDRTQQTHVI